MVMAQQLCEIVAHCSCHYRPLRTFYSAGRSARGGFQKSAILCIMFVQSQYYNDEYRKVQ